MEPIQLLELPASAAVYCYDTEWLIKIEGAEGNRDRHFKARFLVQASTPLDLEGLESQSIAQIEQRFKEYGAVTVCLLIKSDRLVAKEVLIG